MIHKAASYLLIAMSELITSLKLDQWNDGYINL